MATPCDGAIAIPRHAPPALPSRIAARLFGYVALALLGAGAVHADGAAQAKGTPQADFDGHYAVGNWTTTATAGGSVNTTGAPASITLIGSDTRTESPQRIDFTIIATADGEWSFDWRYETEDNPGFDIGGYLLNGQFTFLAEGDENAIEESGSVGPIAVKKGDVIGFSVQTPEDDDYGPGILTISNFKAPVPFALSGFTYNPATGESLVSILGAANTAYKLVEAADLDFAHPDRDPVPLVSAAPGTVSDDKVTTDGSGNATIQFNLGTTKDATFIRAQTAE